MGGSWYANQTNQSYGNIFGLKKYFSRIRLLLSHVLPEREGGGGAPTFFVVMVVVACAEKSRAGAGDRPAGVL